MLIVAVLAKIILFCRKTRTDELKRFNYVLLSTLADFDFVIY